MKNSPQPLLNLADWTTRAAQHEALLAPYCEAFIERRSKGQAHPVHDFLFCYYNCSPSKLRQWVPSYSENLEINKELRDKHYPWLSDRWFHLEMNVLSAKKESISQGVMQHAKFIAELSSNILARPARFGCFGLHEWAMVYKLPFKDLRHQGYRLRLAENELAEFVESQTLCCTHYDAYRFFTAEAKPLNKSAPTLDLRLDIEQAGCIHANMDLYKWATKLWPWIGADMLAKAFFLALEGRELDMRASPYDLSHLGYRSIPIETEEGRKEYQLEQQNYSQQANLLRVEIKEFCQRFLQCQG